MLDQRPFDVLLFDLGGVLMDFAGFDDTPLNVEAALDAGLKAHAVDGIADLTTRLRRLGITSPALL